MTPVYILIIGVILIVGNYISKHWRKWWYRNDINVPAPATKRTDLYYGYFGCLFDQVEETRDHVNLLNEAQFEGPERAARNMVAAGVDCMLCVTPQLLQRINGAQNTVRADAQASLFGFFRFLSDAGALKFVKFLTPFVNFAQANQEVAMVLPFLWLDDQWGTVGVPGIRSGSLRSAYVNAGKSIINWGCTCRKTTKPFSISRSR